jgi:hypothetical protein
LANEKQRKLGVEVDLMQDRVKYGRITQSNSNKNAKDSGTGRWLVEFKLLSSGSS